MALSGNEILFVQGIDGAGHPAATTQQTTTGAIAALGSSESSFVSTSITTVGNGTLTAAGMVSGQIVRTGPVAAFTDTTDTATNIVAALPTGAQSVTVLIKNATAFVQTIAAGAGVTLPLTVIVPPFSVGEYQLTIQSATAVTLIHLDTIPVAIGANITAPAAVSISTVGAGTLTAASFFSGLISRGGAQSSTAFTDTTDTAANIIAACANLVNKVGAAMFVDYSNTTNATATITGGTGVTVSGVTTVPPNTIGRFLVTYTAAATLTMVGVGVTQNIATAVTVLGSSTGVSAIQSGNTGATNFVSTLPAVTGVLSSTTGANLYTADLKKSSATITSSSTTLANVTGLSFTVVPGTYKFTLVLQGVADGTGGIKYAFNYTTAVLSSLQATANGTTAAASATQSTTTATTQATLYTQAAAVLQVLVHGTMVVTTGGTVDVQVAQQAANASSTTVLGSTAEFIRIA